MRQKELFPITKYCIDADSLIDLHRGYPKRSPNGIFSPIWKKIENMIKSQEIISSVEVYREIKERSDDVYEWCMKNRKIFKEFDDCQINNIGQVLKQYDRSHFQSKLNTLGPWADPCLIALTICEEGVIITKENKNKPNRIPVIARHFNIRSINLLEFLEEIGIKL